MKKVITASILIVGLTAGLAFAHGHGYGMRGQGKGWGGYSQSGSCCGAGGGAGFMGSGRGMRGYQGNPADCPKGLRGGQQAWTSEQHQQFLDETVELRKQMNTKRFELREARRNPNTTAEQLGTLEKQLIDLRTQMQSKAEQIKPAAQ